MSEHRREERRKVMVFTPVYDKFANVLLGYLSDLTLKGGLMVSEKPIDINKQFMLAIEFREASESQAKRLTIPARVAWTKQESDMTFYNTGFEFLEMTEANKKIIEAVLERYQFIREIPA